MKELKSLRDTIAHSHTERMREYLDVPKGEPPPLVIPDWHKKVTREFLSHCMTDAEALMKHLNEAARSAFPENDEIEENILTGFFGTQNEVLDQ